jgi:hypothetical protein
MRSNSTAWQFAQVVGVVLLILVIQGIPIMGTVILTVVVYLALRSLPASNTGTTSR